MLLERYVLAVVLVAILRVVLDAVDVLVALLATWHWASERFVILDIALVHQALVCRASETEVSRLVGFLLFEGIIVQLRHCKIGSSHTAYVHYIHIQSSYLQRFYNN